MHIEPLRRLVNTSRASQWKLQLLDVKYYFNKDYLLLLPFADKYVASVSGYICLLISATHIVTLKSCSHQKIWANSFTDTEQHCLEQEVSRSSTMGMGKMATMKIAVMYDLLQWIARMLSLNARKTLTIFIFGHSVRKGSGTTADSSCTKPTSLSSDARTFQLGKLQIS